MKRSLFAGLLVFLLLQNNRLAGLDWEPGANQLRVPVEMVRAHTIPTLALTLVNKANVPAKTVSAAKTEVEKIYRQAGVEVVWNSTEHRDRSNMIHVTVVIVRNCVNKKTCDDPFAAGMALGSDGRGARWAYVFYNRVREWVDNPIGKTLLNTPRESQILGIAIAHEAGHLLLPPGHVSSGLMRSEIDIATFSEATSHLHFTPEQAVRIRNLLTPVRNPALASLRIPEAFVIASAPKIVIPAREGIPAEEQ